MQEKKSALAAIGRDFAVRGWSVATSSNYSARIDHESLLLTKSGRDKAGLTEDDLMAVNLEAEPVDDIGARPSAEALLHCMLYQNSEVGCVLHTHSPFGTVLSMAGPNVRSLASKEKDDEIILENYEMLKALENVSTHEHREVIHVFENTQNMAELRGQVEPYLRENPGAHAYLIKGHGLYTWAATIEQARIQIEALEFMFECEYRHRMLEKT